MTPEQIAKTIDHSILHPLFTDQDLIDNCKIAAEHKTATVCVKPYHTKKAAEILTGTGVGICAVIGFPHGNSSTEMKVAETLQVIEDGATEVDMVVNIGKVMQHDWSYVEQEIQAINHACVQHKVLLKVIFETDFITRTEDKIQLCKICSHVKVAFVKTSTGYGYVKQADGSMNYTGATVEDIQLFRKHCAPDVQIKAAGGIRNLTQILQMIDAGATRVGATATVAILKEANNQ